MAYANVSHFRAYLPQVEAGDAVDSDIQDVLERATGIVQNELGSHLVFRHEGVSTPVASTKTVFSEDSVWLKLPAYAQGSITSLTPSSDTTPITDYEERWEFGRFYLWRETGWQAQRYRVTAIYEYGKPSHAVVEVVLEVAVNLWRGRDRGMFQEIQSQGVGVTQLRFIGGLTTNQQRMIQQIRRDYTDGVM